MVRPAAAGGCGGWFAVLNGSAGAPPNGALISTTERNTSGRVSAHQAATGEPKSCPTTAATERYPNAATSAEHVADVIERREGREVVVEVDVPVPSIGRNRADLAR